MILFVAAAATGGYFLGKQKVTAKTVTAPKNETGLTLPTDATIISQCAVGRGTQYALPKDIPLGPVYNVYQGKVIGIEFMAGKDALLTQNQSFLDLPLRAQKYDHVNIGILSQGHAGFPSPHYHVDVMMISKAETDKITCKS